MAHISRREFLSRAAKGAATVALGTAAMSSAGPARAKSPNDRIVMALMGAGGRGSQVIRSLGTHKDVELAWICDVDAGRGNDLVAHFEKTRGKAPKKTQELRRVLDDKDVDALLVATPDHWHALATIWACQAGKDVYVEKPPTHNIWEGRKMVEAARKYKRIVQVGTQGRSAPYIINALKYIQEGKLGKIHLCKVFNFKPGYRFTCESDSEQPKGVDYDAWLGPVPKRPFNRSHFHNGWHNFWAYCGGEITDDGIHQVDIARWLIGKDWPKAVHCSGGRFAYDDKREVPDLEIMTFDYDDMVMTIEMTQFTPYMDKIAGKVREGDLLPYWPQCSTRIELYGTKGLMYVGRHGGGWQVFGRAKEQSGPGELIAQEYGRFPDPPHQQNFLDCIRSRKLPNADVEEGHRSAALLHMGNISLRVGCRRLQFDPKTETFANDDEANALLKRGGRKPYEIPEQV